MIRHSLILAVISLAAVASAGAADPELSAVMKDLAAFRTAAAAYRHHQVSFRATVSDGGLIRQPAMVTLGFDMEGIPRVGGDRAIRNLRYSVELLPVGGLALPGYVLRSPAPEPRPFAFSTETRDGVNFTVEARAHVDPGAEGTVLKWALTRDSKGTLYGKDVTLMMHPYCSRDLKSCRLGQVAGVADGSTLPTYRLSSEEDFSLAPEGV